MGTVLAVGRGLTRHSSCSPPWLLEGRDSCLTTRAGLAPEGGWDGFPICLLSKFQQLLLEAGAQDSQLARPKQVHLVPHAGSASDPTKCSREATRPKQGMVAVLAHPCCGALG